MQLSVHVTRLQLWCHCSAMLRMRTASVLVLLKRISMLAGTTLTVNVYGEKITITGPMNGARARVVMADIMSCSAVIHAIDEVRQFSLSLLALLLE